MIKVYDNGVPLAAVVSVEIGDDPMVAFADLAISFKLREDQIREFRARWAKEWPEIAARWAKK